MSIEAMKQALEALESTQPENPHSIESKAIKSLRQAIAEAEKQEPVAYVPQDALEQLRPPMLILRGVPIYGYSAEGAVAVYTAPPAAQPCPTCEALARAVMMDQGGTA